MSRAELRAYLAWTRAAGPFWQYVAAMPFLVHPSRHRAPLPLDAARTAIERSILPFFDSARGRVALLLDLPPDLGLATTLAFHEERWLVVPVMSRWPTERPALPVDSLLAQLIWLSAELRPPAEPRGIVFLLDAERQTLPHPDAVEHKFDNRYVYSTDDLPSARMLLEWGVEAVGVAAHYHHAPEDVEYITGELSRAGLAVTRVWVPPI